MRILGIARGRLAQISLVREASQSATSPELVGKALGFGRKLQAKSKEATARKKAEEEASQAATPRRTKNSDSQDEQHRWVGLLQYKRTSSDRRGRVPALQSDRLSIESRLPSHPRLTPTLALTQARTRALALRPNPGPTPQPWPWHWP